MPSATVIPETPTSLRVFPVSIDSIDNQALAMDLYLRPADDNDPVLYRSNGIQFSNADRKRLITQGVRFLYIPVNQHAAYRHALKERLSRLFHDPTRNRMERGHIVRDACTKMIQDVLLFPGQPEVIETVAEVGRQCAAWSLDDDGQFSYLLDMSAHDFCTATHMVNVGVGCGLLFKELCPGEPELQAEIVLGGLLHDIGKRSVKEELLSKEGDLDPQEWDEVKKHPLAGYQELKTQPGTPATVLEMVQNHHERPDGQGYPNGLKGDQVGFAARLCTVVDVFDAITASRPYRGPTPPLDTLETMVEGSGAAFDRDLLETWSRIVKRLIAEDPTRAPASNGHTPRSSLAELTQNAPTKPGVDTARDATHRSGHERRRHTRYPCTLHVNVSFLRLGKPGPLRPGEYARLRLVDISQGGAQLRTQWPLSLNDLLTLELPVKAGQTVTKLARVVRVRSDDQGRWMAGLCFLAEEVVTDSANSVKSADAR
ncbi:MAG TPA: HD domain-containing phosphohydrolase [Phycisphaerae bacterium]|nr:HD domain-containing phosphohydrolase [Phycisphaerae bacterium]